MVQRNKIKPISESSNSPEPVCSVSSLVGSADQHEYSRASSKEVNDYDSLSTIGLEESSFLKLKPFSRLDPTLSRMLTFLNFFGLTVNFERSNKEDGGKVSKIGRINYQIYIKILIMTIVEIITGEVVYDINLRQSKLLAEQKRSTPLLTFVIVAYSWLTLIIPIICDISLIFTGSHLFRFYSRTTTTVCNGMFFGKRTSVDSWYYYLTLVLLAFLDSMGQVVVLGVWPQSVTPFVKMILFQDGTSSKAMSFLVDNNKNETSNLMELEMETTRSGLTTTTTTTVMSSFDTQITPKIRAHLLDYMLGESYAHSDIGVCLKIACLMVQFMHSYSFLMIIISLANHYAMTINNINENLDKYDFRRLLKQLIILRDSTEQISLMISIPFASVITLVFMRQIALNGVFIQSTMLPYENWAVSLQSFTCSISIFMVFIYCDGLQSASKQTHRLKTEQTVINENRGGNQSIYEFLDYLNRLSKSVRITFFSIIAINKSSLAGLYGHILTLTFVTS